MLSIHFTTAAASAPLRLLSRAAAAKRDPARCPSGHQTLVRSPIQGLQHQLYYCIDDYRRFVAVPLEQWSEYVWQPASVRVTTSNVVAFARHA